MLYPMADNYLILLRSTKAQCEGDISIIEMSFKKVSICKVSTTAHNFLLMIKLLVSVYNSDPAYQNLFSISTRPYCHIIHRNYSLQTTLIYC